MSDVKHTAGPWVAEDDELRPVCVRGEPNIHKTHTIARLSAWRCGTADEVAQAKANARLMAAAPVLLEALADLLPYCEEDLDGYTTLRYRQSIEMAQAAVRRARGRG